MNKASRSIERLSLSQARRIGIAAQGLNNGRERSVGAAAMRAMIARLGFLQIDSVNVLVRAHYMPLFSRLGAYDAAMLDADAYRPKRRRLFEYWAHEASLIPLDMQPLFRWRMAEAAAGRGIYGGLARFAHQRKAYVEDVLAEVKARGPLAASEIDLGAKGEKGWWGWSDAKTALEYLFWAGEVTTLRRETAGFARIYDLPGRVLPAELLARPTPDKAHAQRALLRHAARALGVASATDLREYFRLPVEDARLRLAELEEACEVVPVAVEGWSKPGYLDPAAKLPRKVDAATLLSPFDPLISERGRAERLFDFHYRLEIYTPAHKRKHGYYCLPLLMGERIVARLDLKADRAANVLRVEAAHAEEHADVGAVAEAARVELARMSAWLGLGEVRSSGRGDLGKALKA